MYADVFKLGTVRDLLMKEVLSLETNLHEKKYDYRSLSISGLGGWMIFVQIGLYITILMLLGQIFQYLPIFTDGTWNTLTQTGSEIYHPLWGPVIIFEMIYNILFLLFSAFILITLYRKKSIFPTLMIIFYSGSFIIRIIDQILIYQIALVVELEDGSSIREILKSVITCAIWIPYFIRSERVHNTFIQ
jgi:hypothetical protein